MGHRARMVLVASLLLIAAGCQKPIEPADTSADWELKPPAADATPVAAKEKMLGIYPVGSRIEDRKAPGGFGPCSNFPKDLAGQEWGTKGTVAIVAFPEEPVAYFKHRGFALRVVNRTSEDVSFSAIDSCLTLVCEAQDANGGWKAIESGRPVICGNSYHQVFLGKSQYWEFPAWEYAGRIKTKLRFRLDPGEGKPAIYSNEFDGQVNAVQLAGG